MMMMVVMLMMIVMMRASSAGRLDFCHVQGVFLHWASPKKLMYEKPRLGESTLT